MYGECKIIQEANPVMRFVKSLRQRRGWIELGIPLPVEKSEEEG